MGKHEPCIGGADEWYTPPAIFDALGLTFDLDPCSPGAHHWVPARQVYTKADDGLSRPWHGLVFMNPPFGGRHGHVPWLRRFMDHGNGIAVVRAYTSSDWFHDVVVARAETMLFPRGKTQFLPSAEVEADLRRRAAEKGKEWRNAPGSGVVLIGMGNVANEALRGSLLGFFIPSKFRSLQEPSHG